jgi:ABC-type glycerol-3-phosphate transport system substrate-binding protein
MTFRRTGLFAVALAALLAAAGGAFAAPPAASVSAYQTLPDDPRAIVVKATGDGVADDSDALQQAIDSAANALDAHHRAARAGSAADLWPPPSR